MQIKKEGVNSNQQRGKEDVTRLSARLNAYLCRYVLLIAETTPVQDEALIGLIGLVHHYQHIDASI